MFVWLAISFACAALAATAPLRIAAPIMAFVVPMSGTAAWMLGDDPLLMPLVVSLGFLARHAMSLLDPQQFNAFLKMARGDVAFLAFIAYCVISGLCFPRLFEGQTTVYPQVILLGGITLNPGQISVVQIAYLLLGAYTYLALRQAMLRTGLEWMVGAILIQVGLFAGFGLLQGLLGLVGVQMPTRWIVNNSGYSLLTSVIEGGFTRITSVFVEASLYGIWATGALAFCYALYLNRVLPAINLCLMAVVGLTLLLSTSSTSYFGLLVIGGYALFNAILDTNERRRTRGIVLLLLGALFGGAALLVMFSASGGVLGHLRDVILDMTVNKGASGSSAERTMLAQGSVKNAADTLFLGTGYGSARSSGLFYQLLGTVGVPGLALFALALFPLLRRAFKRVRTGEDAVVASASFALFCTLGAMAASGSDLGLPNVFWVFAAIAAAPLGMRATARARAMARDEEVEPQGAVEGA